MSKNSRLLLYALLIVLLTTAGAFILIGSFQQSYQKQPLSTQKPVTVSNRILRGNIESFGRYTLELHTDGKTEKLSLKDTSDFQLVTSGDYDQGNAQVTQVTLNHLSPGFEVLVTTKPDSNDVLRVIILKRGYEQFKYKKIP